MFVRGEDNLRLGLHLSDKIISDRLKNIQTSAEPNNSIKIVF